LTKNKNNQRQQGTLAFGASEKRAKGRKKGRKGCLLTRATNAARPLL